MTVAVVFDLDGVVWDLRPHIASILGLDEADVRRRLATGGNVVSLARRHGTSAGTLGLRLARRPDVVSSIVLSTLSELARQDCYLAAATSLSRRIAEPVIKSSGLDEHFRRVICPGRGRRSKPAPDPLLAAVEGTDADEFWYVGDTARDRAAAAAANWLFVWASYGYGPRPHGHIDARIDNIRQLPAALGLA